MAYKKKKFDANITIRLQKKQYDLLDKVSEEIGVTRAEIVRDEITKIINNHSFQKSNDLLN